MYYLTEKERKACAYFESLETFTDEQAESAVKFCCSVCGCTREEQAYLLEWYFDGYCADLVHFGNKYNGFNQLLNYCGDSFIIAPGEHGYHEYLNAMLDGYQINGEELPTGRLFLQYV